MNMEIAIKLRDKLLEISDNNIDFAKGVMVNTQSDECRQSMLDIIEEHPEADTSRLLLVSVALGEWEKEHGLRSR